ncbi:formin 3 [Striga asiatica]|uniref:Formin 3 n=1 Tax=Striga asiatica TaxID=4170 RepID=A0A5A7P727_STRAF|nr:formin 3 [Striga asiatica]
MTTRMMNILVSIVLFQAIFVSPMLASGRETQFFGQLPKGPIPPFGLSSGPRQNPPLLLSNDRQMPTVASQKVSFGKLPRGPVPPSGPSPEFSPPPFGLR